MDNITNSLAEYSSTVNQYADKINGGFIASRFNIDSNLLSL